MRNVLQFVHHLADGLLFASSDVSRRLEEDFAMSATHLIIRFVLGLASATRGDDDVAVEGANMMLTAIAFLVCAQGSWWLTEREPMPVWFSGFLAGGVGLLTSGALYTGFHYLQSM